MKKTLQLVPPPGVSVASIMNEAHAVAAEKETRTTGRNIVPNQLRLLVLFPLVVQTTKSLVVVLEVVEAARPNLELVQAALRRTEAVASKVVDLDLEVAPK